MVLGIGNLLGGITKVSWCLVLPVRVLYSTCGVLRWCALVACHLICRVSQGLVQPSSTSARGLPLWSAASTQVCLLVWPTIVLLKKTTSHTQHTTRMMLTAAV